MKLFKLNDLVLLFLVFVLIFAQTGSIVFADVRLPAVIGNHMVLQQNIPLSIWGWADPGESVTVQLGKHKVRTKTDMEGKWQVKLPEMVAGGPYEMVISGKNTITLKDIMVGEVWVCSGQSNMEWRMRSVNNSVEEILNANYPQIRLFQIPKKAAAHPQTDVNAEWRQCNPRTVIDFSAVAYFFGRELHKKLNVPVGLILTCWGGTRIEPWTPPEGFKMVPELKDIVRMIEKADDEYHVALGKSLNEIEKWISKAKAAYANNQDLPNMPHLSQHPLMGREKPTSLYNAMVYPIIPFAIRGAIWYQGEANRNDGAIYYEKMKALINGWRKVWKQGDFPFYYVQLAPFCYTLWDSGNRGVYRLPIIREAQRKALSIPNTGMVVTTDIGNIYDIHPRNKQEVGRRLALWALAKTYGQKDLVYSGPLYRSMEIDGNKIQIYFEHVGSGLTTRDGKPLDWFEIAGPDKKFFRAQAVIKGNTVEVWSPEVENPVAVRFGWHEEAEPNLINREGLPASPFSTE